VHQLFGLDRDNQRIQFGISVAKKKQLVLQVSMNGCLDRSRTNPNALTAQQRGQEAQHQSAISPQRHYAAGPRISTGHGVTKQSAMSDFMAERFLEKRNDIWTPATRHINLRTIDANGAVLACVVDLQDSGDRQTFSHIHGFAPIPNL
jgi:hypothetical protein